MLLNGELIEPPYSVEFVGGDIEINGYSFAVETVAVPEDGPEIEIPKAIRDSTGFVEDLVVSYHDTREVKGVDEAEAELEDRLETDPIVEDYTFLEDGSIQLKFAGLPGPTSIFGSCFDPEYELPSPKEVDDANTAFLESLVNTMKHCLEDAGGYCIAYGTDYVHMYSGKEGRVRFDRITEILTSDLDSDTKTRQLESLLGHAELAKLTLQSYDD